MASLLVSCVLFLISCAIVGISQANSYFSYKGGGGRELPPAEFFPLRHKRYVSSPINRLADSYDKGFSSPDHRKDDGRHRAEFIGNLAVMGELETSGGIAHPTSSSPTIQASSHTPPSYPTLEPVPEKPGKKPGEDKYPKKAMDVQKPQDKTTATIAKTGNDSPPAVADDDVFPKEMTNNTLAKHNITKKQEDHHVYYTSEFMSGESTARHYWVDLEKERGITHEMLSQSHRRAATVRLSFDFPFYGHLVRNMTVATGGFIYTGDYIHSWLAATQYIAPLMANFDTSMSNGSFVKYRDNGTSFTVEWARVSLQDKKDAGEFTFQVTLHNNGDIVFVYKAIPIQVEQIADTLHPVKVGLSDAYIIDKSVFYIRKKTIYEYHRVSFSRDDIKNWTVIYMKALPTCVSLKDCYSCVNHNTTFTCKWCDSIKRCSSGYDRFLQDWSQNSCPNTAISESQFCSKSTHQRDTSLPPSVGAQSKVEEARETRLSHSGVLGLFLVVCILTCLGLWVFHAYRNPHTRLGQVLIKYRPSQWRRRGEARYTAATIHM